MAWVVSLQCSSDEAYVRIWKASGSDASHESFTLSADGTVVYSSPPLNGDGVESFEVCVPVSSTSIYTLTLKDSNNIWSDSSWISLSDINEAVVLRAFMMASHEETYNVALYTPVPKRVSWAYSTSFSSKWKDFTFNDETWSSSIVGSTFPPVQTIYFRKYFTGITGMAAVTLMFLYRMGIVSYINGVEVYRDHMSAGEPSYSTKATTSYSTADWHGILRPAFVAEAPRLILAVELHSLSTPSINTFDAYLLYHAGVSDSNLCFVSPMDVSVTTDKFANPSATFNFLHSFSSVLSSSLPASVTATFSANPPLVNGIRLWIPQDPSLAPSAFTFSGVNPSITLLSVTNQTYSESVWKQWYIDPPLRYNSYKMMVTSGNGNTVNLAMQFLVCNEREVAYPLSTYIFYALYSTLDLHLTSNDISDCQIAPSLPDGLSLDASCTITGASRVTTPPTTFTITGVDSSQHVKGTVTLSFEKCQGSLYHVLRTYRVSPNAEFYHIRDASTGEVLLEAGSGHEFPANKDHSDYLCVKAASFDVSIDASTAYWQPGSYLFLYSVISNTEEELILKTRFDSYLEVPTVYSFYRNSINSFESWFYKMSLLPAKWFDANTEGWREASRGTFPLSSNQIQLYKKTFTIDSVEQVTGLVLSGRFLFGCVVYVNGIEVWRNHVVGDLTGASLSTDTYSELTYHTISLPGRIVSEHSTTVIHNGANVIAIAILANSTSTQRVSLFDASLRLMKQSESHMWEFEGSMESISGDASNAFDLNYQTVIESSSCSSNSILLTLNNDRREWVNMVQIQNSHSKAAPAPVSFDLYGKNPEDSEWTLLTRARALHFILAYQKRSVFFINNRAFNQFKFVDFSVSGCSWRVQSLNLYAVTVMTPPSPLTYPSATTVFTGIEMEALTPENEGLFNYTIRPSLPSGLLFDVNNGWITGVCNLIVPSTKYSVSAKTILGTTVTVTFSLAVQRCTGDRGLVTIHYQAQSMLNRFTWKLILGRGATGSVLRSFQPYPFTMNGYIDFCLPEGVYTFQPHIVNDDASLLGYTLSVDDEEMIIETEMVRSASQVISTVFSTFLPFQVNSTRWKVYQRTDAIPENWNLPSFNDSQWSTYQAAAIPNSGSVITTYIRKSFTLLGANEFRVLNVRVKYAGGVVAYFNGNRVARFNIDEHFDPDTESIQIHDPTLFSKFHVILSGATVRRGTNVMSFEVHRPYGSSSSDPFVFDATGVFGVDDCATVVDTYSSMDSSLGSSDLISLFDLDPFTSVTLPTTSGSFVEWEVENQEGSQWNAFNILSTTTMNYLQSYLYGYASAGQSDRVTLLSKNVNIQGGVKQPLMISSSENRYYRIRHELVSTQSSQVLTGLLTAYCESPASFCASVDGFPSAGEDQLSYASCPDGFGGYLYRVCSGGVLGSVVTSRCFANKDSKVRPSNFSYPKPTITVIKGKAFSMIPSVHGDYLRFRIVEGTLPEGIRLDLFSGELSGVTSAVGVEAVMIEAWNTLGAVKTSVEVKVDLLPMWIMICVGVAAVVVVVLVIVCIVRCCYRKCISGKSNMDIV